MKNNQSRIIYLATKQMSGKEWDKDNRNFLIIKKQINIIEMLYGKAKQLL